MRKQGEVNKRRNERVVSGLRNVAFFFFFFNGEELLPFQSSSDHFGMKKSLIVSQWLLSMLIMGESVRW